ncbi:MAG: glycosyltransferase family 2 protein [Candidatus Magasanikbacteria bacterium]|nr:glycosyltransferase family 2 protein [Candidatus Magasanikbacteria bacterium]
MHKKNPLFSIVIPVYNEEKMIDVCIDFLEAQVGDFDYEIIVVNNNSTDKTRAIVEKRNVILIDEMVPGVGVARRAGTAVARGQYIMHVDADTHLPPSYLHEVLRRFDRDQKLACVGGQFFYYDAPVWIGFLRFFTHWGLWFFSALVSLGKVGPMGNNMTFKKEVYDKTAGFDAHLKYGEDMDLCRKLSAFGRVWLDMRLRCEISVRRFVLNKRLWVYFLNFLTMSIVGKSYDNELPHPDEIDAS